MKTTRRTGEDAIRQPGSKEVRSRNQRRTPSGYSDRSPRAEYSGLSLVAVGLLLIVVALMAGKVRGVDRANADALKDTRLLSTSQAFPQGAGTAQPRVARTPQGHVRMLAAPPAQHFSVSSVIPGNPQVNAKNFLQENRAKLGLRNKAFDLTPGKTKTTAGHSYVRYRQVYAGHEVFGAEIVTQLDEADGVEYVSADILTDDDTPAVDGLLSVPATLTASQAEALAVGLLAGDNPGREFRAELATQMIYVPTIVGNAGAVRLVWQTRVAGLGDSEVAELVLVDAHSGEIALRYSLVREALYRQTYNARYGNSKSDSILVRAEGNSPCGLRDADLAHDYVGDAYNFFLVQHGRDGVDGRGMTPTVYVYVGPSTVFTAGWNPFGYMIFGADCVCDDGLAHEYTHGVLQYEVDFIYLNESGAIDEALADAWGEWIDQMNGRGDDAASVKWLVGEDLIPPWSYPDKRPALRNMKNPAQWPYQKPDRKGSSYWHNWHIDSSDKGGIHTNCGVGNKLCYLLTEGDTFNGYSISGMGVGKVADLFYEAATNLLTRAADYEDLYFALLQAADNLARRDPAWTWADKLNVENACRAVEIAVTSWPAATPAEVEVERQGF